MRTRLGFLLAALVLAGCGGGSDERRGTLALVSSRDGDYAIYEMGADGSEQRRLTEDGRSPATSPAALFFQVDPSWSPDGTRIAFASRRSGTFDIYVMNADGTETRRLTSSEANDGHPTWSPDGSQIAFDRGATGDIYVMGADGTGVHAVTEQPSDETDPAWSPDGRWIVYVARTPGTSVRELWLVRPDGSERRRLTSLGVESYSPAWSPDGKTVAFSSDPAGLRFEIYRIGVDGKALRRVTRSSEDAFEPAWSPDGTTIAFSRGGSIFTIDEDGDEQELTESLNNDSSPAWKPEPTQG